MKTFNASYHEDKSPNLCLTWIQDVIFVSHLSILGKSGLQILPLEASRTESSRKSLVEAEGDTRRLWAAAKSKKLLHTDRVNRATDRAEAKSHATAFSKFFRNK